MPPPESTQALPRLRDQDVGIRGFLTDTPPLGGRLKVRIEDFLVEELSEPPQRDAGGAFTAARVRLTNWETNAFVREASARLQRSRHTVQFSGTKDKRGVTERWFTFEASPEEVAALSKMGGVEVLEAFRTPRHVELGQHQANRFRLVLRDTRLGPQEAVARVQETWRQLSHHGGVPNFFGPQRFGARRATTHKVGERILRGDFLGAVMVYLTEPGVQENDALSGARRELARTRDWKRGLQDFQGDVVFERALLHRLVETGGDGIEALRALPKNLQRLFVSAFQSWIFNDIVSTRLAQGLPLSQPIEGDLVAPVEQGRVQDEWVPVRSSNLERCRLEVERGRAAVTGLLPGTQVPLAEGRMGDIERTAMAKADVQPRDFLVPEQLEWSSKGTRRALAQPVGDLSWNAGPDDLYPGACAVAFAFSLPPGSYATMVLREFVKSPWLDDYG